MTTGTDGEARTGQSMASRLQHQIFYLAIHVGGRRLAYGLLFFVVLWYTALPKIRARSRPYLSRRFSGAGPLAMLWHAFRLNLAFGCTLVDRAVAGITGDFSVTASKEDEDTALGLAAEGKGVVLLTAHVGNWQSVLSKLTFFPARKTIVMHRADADTDRQYYEHGDGGPPFGIIDPASPLGGSLEMLDALRGGGMLCGMGDRIFGSARNTLAAPFLDDAVRVPFSFYRVAAAKDAPVAIVFTRRTGPGTAVAEVADVIRVPGDLGRKPGAYAPYARRFTQALERFVRDNPYQYYNFYDIWKETGSAHD